MSVPASSPGVASRRQKRMGPAPFASFEDLSDELESPEDKAAGSVVRLPGIREDTTPTPSNTPLPIDHRPPEFVYSGISLVGAAAAFSPPAMATTPTTKFSLQTPSAPRIDISRASSSSHHDSRDSTPERELFESHEPAAVKLGLGFKEEGALDLRSSTEELDFQDQTVGGVLSSKSKKGKARPQSPSCLHDDSSSVHYHQRKDSQSSELGFLCISGRTSRLSSIGSQGSGHSRLSNASHLSVISGQSGLSRSPSPHKMLLETSFCGTKPPVNASTATELQGTKVDTEDLEKVVLARKHDPTKAVLAEGISVSEQDKKATPEKPARKAEENKDNASAVQTSAKSDITIKVDEPSNNSTKIPKKIVKNGVEYIYIPLKGPLPIDNDPQTTTSSTSKHQRHQSQSEAHQPVTKTKLREVKSANAQSRPQHPTSKEKSSALVSGKPKSKSATPSPVSAHKKEDEEPKYIRIRLKPDYMYSQEDADAASSTPSTSQKPPDSLDLSEANKKTTQNLNEIITIQRDETPIKTQQQQQQEKSLSSTPSASPKLPRQSFLREVESKTPSPSLSRKSSFASLFRSKETIISPESPTIPGSCRRKNTISGILREAGESLRERSRSRSKSRERDKSLSAAPSSTESIDSKSKQKSVFSIFKPKKTDSKQKLDHDSTSSSEVLPSIEGIAKVEFKFNENSSKSAKKKYYETPLEGESIRIPLHSPTHYDDHNILQDLKTSSVDSQETVIEVTSKHVEAIVEKVPQELESNINLKSSKPELSKRQSSTSSDNVVFSTKLGSNNEIFSTKLPKDSDQNKIAQEIPLNGAVTMTEVVTTVIELSEPPPKVVDEIKKDSIIQKLSASNRNSFTTEDDRCSSESERDSEIDLVKNRKDLDLKLALDFAEPERKGLVLQQDSYDDELPYVPTTLPQERSAAIPIVPIKQRSTFEMKTCPIERPRSTTPINPSCLEEYCEEVMGNFNTESFTKSIEKLKISLPRHDSVDKPVKSPRKPTNTTTNWFEFAEKGILAPRRSSLTQESGGETPPPLPPKGVQKEWINFEEIPERRKPPKRIQTLPSRGHIEIPDSVLQDNVIYNYVNPEECKCECHERREKESAPEPPEEDEMPLLEDDAVDEEKTVVVERITLDVTVSDRRSVVSDSSVDLSTSVEPPEANGGLDLSLQTPFTSDLGLSSNRSSIVSQDEPQSPDPGSPNAFPKTF